MYARRNFHRQQHWQLAERQRYLTELESLAERLCADIERMNGEIGQTMAADAAETGQVHGVFLRPLINRRDKLRRSVAEIDTQIAEARAAVAVAQQEIRLVGSPPAQRGLAADEPGRTRRVRRPS